MTTSMQQNILEKKDALAASVGAPLSALAVACAEVWPEPDALDQLLLQDIDKIPGCSYLYAWNLEGTEISSLVQPASVDSSWRGRDLSNRPYLKNNLPFKGIMLSSVYQSMTSGSECVTALQAVRREKALLGFIAADFPLDKLPAKSPLISPIQRWQQFKGDPAVRGTLFLQQRIQSLVDDHIDAVHATVNSLMVRHGIFHTKIHYSSGRCSFWLFDDPYRYQIHSGEEIINPDISLAYPPRAYPEAAVVTPEQLRQTLDGLKALRFADETIYLRSASINIMNGMLGLTFSCDGSHYMPVREFLERKLSFWLGEALG